MMYTHITFATVIYGNHRLLSFKCYLVSIITPSIPCLRTISSVTFRILLNSNYASYTMSCKCGIHQFDNNVFIISWHTYHITNERWKCTWNSVFFISFFCTIFRFSFASIEDDSIAFRPTPTPSNLSKTKIEVHIAIYSNVSFFPFPKINISHSSWNTSF